MTTLTFRWKSKDEDFHYIPAQINTKDRVVVAAPGEKVPIPPGPCTLRIDVPGYALHTVALTVSESSDRQIELSADKLQSFGESEQEEKRPNGLSISAVPYIRPVFPPQRLNGLEVRAVHHELELSARTGSGSSWAMDLIGPRTPQRRLIVPPVPAGENYHLLWYRPGELVRRPRIEPADSGGRLLMNYLLNGQHALAAAAARALERSRGDAVPLSWVAPSYTQLLIGYAHAVAGDNKRLTAWCRRTAATSELGADGLVLAAEAAWQRGDPNVTRELLAVAAKWPPPTITLGGELALNRATSLSLLLDEPPAQEESRADDTRGRERYLPQPALDRAVLAMTNDWTRALMRADSQSLSLSTAESDRRSPDLEWAPWWDRVRWRLRYWMSRAGYIAVRARPILFTFAKELSVSNPEISIPAADSDTRSKAGFRGVLLLAYLLLVALVLIVGTDILVAGTGALGPIVWLAEGALLSVALLAVGGYVGAFVYRERLTAAEVRLEAAEDRARRFHEAAMKGRALAAVLDADAGVVEDMTDVERAICRRHAAIAERLEIY